MVGQETPSHLTYMSACFYLQRFGSRAIFPIVIGNRAALVWCCGVGEHLSLVMFGFKKVQCSARAMSILSRLLKNAIVGFVFSLLLSSPPQSEKNTSSLK